jgi:RNA polymerase sigma-70 factor (ECF subfamily)
MEEPADSYRRFLRGDINALSEIVGAYREGLILYLNTFVRDVYLAEDLTEETFVKLLLKKPRLKDSGAFKTWLYTIGANLARDYLRSVKHPEDPLEDHPYLTDKEALEHSYIRQENKRMVHKALEKLKPEYRQVLWLAYFEGFSYKEIAHILHKTTHNIETIAYRARQALKTILIMEGFDYENLS